MLRRVKLVMQCTNVLTWELNRYRRQTTDDRRRTTDDRQQTTYFKSFFPLEQADRGFTRLQGFAAGAVLFDLGGIGAFWQKKGVTLRGLRISEKK